MPHRFWSLNTQAYLRDKIKKLKEQYTANPNLKIMKDAQESSGNKGRKKR